MTNVNDSSPSFVIIGGGIVGLTLAYELRQKYPSSKITILEKEKSLGQHASGKNSGILHSGIYYGADTLKAKVCASGAKRMIAFAREQDINVRQSGKVIIPTNEAELSVLPRLMSQAEANGIEAHLLSADEIRSIEPAAKAFKQGIHCPTVGVIDAKTVLNALHQVLEKKGVEVKLGFKVEQIITGENCVRGAGESFTYDYLINSAGAYADTLAKKFGLASHYELIPFKGFYYKLNPAKADKIYSNIYPVPNPAMPFLGVHFTRVINDEVYIGPTAVPVFGRENYRGVKGLNAQEGFAILKRLSCMYFGKDKSFRALVHREIWNYWKPYFVEQGQKMVEGLSSEDFMPCEKAGIRPQLVDTKTQQLVMDFKVEQTSNSLHVLNAISPAFTSSFALAEYLVREKITI